MTRLNFFYLALFALSFGFTSCDDDDAINITPTTFTVTVENVSTPNTVATDRAMGTVPLSPPVWAVSDEDDDPMFEVGEKANLGTERIAEDGFPDEMLAILSADNEVKASGAAPSPGGPDNGPALFAGESSSFTFTARPGDKLQFETMFVQSNDWFYAFNDGGLELFDDNTPKTGDFTGNVVVYDAGTEQDTAPGTGPDQKPVQEASATNVGPDEDEDIELAAGRHPGFTIPAGNRVIRVTVTPAG